MKKLLILAQILAFVAFGQNPAEEARRLFADYYEILIRQSPEDATFIGRNDFDRLWTDYSKAGIERRRQENALLVRRINDLPLDQLSKQDHHSARLMKWQLERRIESEAIDNYLLSVYQMGGLHLNVYSVVDRMPARTVGDYENIIARLKAVPAYIDQGIALVEEGMQQKIVQPRLIAERMISQVQAQLSQKPEESSLLEAFRRFPASIPADQQKRLKAEAAAAYNDQFSPAWRKLQAFLSGPYLAKARQDVGLSAIPNGAAIYATQVRRYTTTSLTAADVHQIGLREVERIEGEMQTILKEVGFAGNVNQFQKDIRERPDQRFRDKEEMLAYCRNVAKIVEPELPRMFKNLPRLYYGIRPIAPDREAASASHATPPTPDGKQPGWFNLNTYQATEQVRYDKQALVLHEAVPGHLFQISYQHQISGLPDFRRNLLPANINSAYVEGWALYTESLGPELGVYKDPYSRFGQLSSERFRAVRLVVDTGIHAFGWNRQRAVDYFATHAPSSSLAEIDRYIGWPGQALSYKMGQLKILELRRFAESELGARFDLRDFHDVVLRSEGLPLEMLDEEVRAYVKERKTVN